MNITLLLCIVIGKIKQDQGRPELLSKPSLRNNRPAINTHQAAIIDLNYYIDFRTKMPLLLNVKVIPESVIHAVPLTAYVFRLAARL